LKFLKQEQVEFFQNSLGGLIQILIIKLKGNPCIGADMIQNIFALVKSLCEANRKVIVGGLFIVHSLIFNLEKGIE
jgi:hypothetical protein